MKLKSLRSFGNSMWPLLRGGDKIIIKQSKKYFIDDIVVVKRKTDFITHRLIYIDPQKKIFITKGDNNKKNDLPFKRKKIVGKVVYVVRNNRKILLENIYKYQTENYLKELFKLNKSLINKNINFVYLKGIFTYLNYFNKNPKRIYSDCDILIEKDSLIKVNNIFEKNGFTLVKKTFLNLKLFSGSQFLYRKIINKVPINIDLHTDAGFLFTNFSFLNKYLFDEKKLTELNKIFLNEKCNFNYKGSKIPILSFENQIIYLSLHFFHHNFRGYFRISLINELINLNRSIYYKKYIKSINKIIKYFSIKKYFNLTDQLLREKYENYIFLENNLQTKLNNKKFYLTFQNEGSKIFSGISRYFNCLKYSNSGLAKKAFVLFHPLFLIKIIFYFLENVFPKLKSFSFLKNQKIH